MEDKSMTAEYLNNREQCIVCFQTPKYEPINGAEKNDPFSKPQSPLKKQKIDDVVCIETPLNKHHVTYFPEKIAFVHYDCHKKIHDPDNPMTQWIQYTEEEKKLFYKNKKQTDKTLGTKIKYNL